MSRIQDSRRRTFVLLVAIVAGGMIGAVLMVGYDSGALRLSLALAVPAAESWLPGAPVTREEVTVVAGDVRLVADLYRPARPRGAILLVHGLSSLGRRQPDLARMALLLAREDRLVLVPHYPGLAGFRLEGAEVGTIVASIDDLARRPGAAPLVVAGFSFGAGPALLAAAQRPEVRLAASFGGYADLREVIGFVTTAPASEPYNRWKLLSVLVAQVSDAAERERVGAIAAARLANPGADTTSLETRLVGEGRVVLALVRNERPDAVPALIAALPPEVRRALDDLAALPAAPRLRGRLLVAHGREDVSIPYAESVRLAEAGGARVVILETFHHTGPRPFLALLLPRVRDGVRLVRAADRLLSARGL
jgi:pimeloyl-ACP methyl ester carboxylesterase